MYCGRTQCTGVVLNVLVVYSMYWGCTQCTGVVLNVLVVYSLNHGGCFLLQIMSGNKHLKNVRIFKTNKFHFKFILFDRKFKKIDLDIKYEASL